jgi:hypothetical protein
MPQSKNGSNAKAAFTVCKGVDGQAFYRYPDGSCTPFEGQSVIKNIEGCTAHSSSCGCRSETFPPLPIPLIATIHGQGSWRTEPTHVKN